MTNMIFQRTSIRKYNQQSVSNEQVELLLKAAMAAPSARNIQPWEFIAIQNKQTLNKIADFSQSAHMLKEASLAIVVCADLDKEIPAVKGKNYWIQDCSAATENILLEATELGLGSVWIGTYPKDEMVKPVKALFNLPENIVPVSIISIGHPEGETKPKDKFNKEKIHYEEW